MYFIKKKKRYNNSSDSLENDVQVFRTVYFMLERIYLGMTVTQIRLKEAKSKRHADTSFISSFQAGRGFTHNCIFKMPKKSF